MRYAAIEGYRYPYRISEAGVVESCGSGQWVPLTPTMRGRRRVVVRLWTLEGRSISRGVANLMGEAFLGGVPQNHGVFHKNGALWDNELENLEIRPISAGGGNKRSYPVIKIDRWGKVVEVYGSAREAARKNHISIGSMRERLWNHVADPFRLDGHDYQYEANWTGTGKRRKVKV